MLRGNLLGELPMRRFAALALLALAGGCTPDMFVSSVLPHGVEVDPFGTTSLARAPTEPGYAEINNADPAAGALKARLTCTLGASLGEAQTLPGDAADFSFQRADCTPYRLSLF